MDSFMKITRMVAAHDRALKTAGQGSAQALWAFPSPPELRPPWIVGEAKI
jgi:hypothetical protein